MKPAISIFFSILILLAMGAGCEREDPAVAAPAATATSAPAPVTAPVDNRPSDGPRIVFLGDSITAGLGLSADQAFPAILGDMLRAEDTPVQIVNAGVSGDTTAGGLRRLDWLLRQRPDIVVVGLGGNDGLRGLELGASEENLRAIIQKCREAGARVLLLGMLIPPNYGPEYTAQFRDLYPRLAQELDVPMVPFVLDKVGGEAHLNQADGIHPTAEGHELVAKNVLPHLRPLLSAQRPAGP